MDALDIGILRSMGFNPFGTAVSASEVLRPARIAKELQVREETVRDRIRGMERRGVIAGYQANPNLRLFGLETTSYLYRPKETGASARWRKGLSSVDYLLQTHHFLEGPVCIDLCYRTTADLDRRVRLLGHLIGDEEPARFFAWPMPPPPPPLSQLRWRILRALRGNARRPLPEVAKELGVPYRTVKRHHDAMATDGSFSVHPIVQPGKDVGLIGFWLLFFFAPNAPASTPQRLVRAFQDRYVYADVPPTPEFGHLGMILFGDSPAQIEALRQRAEREPGVERAAVFVPFDILDHGSWLDEQIDQKIRETEA